ncbi:MAG: hypothetical protein SCALA702_03960 [Melioribacteraceae bacterium]|nr:MAG: hypothetical protein SCALA702_03960 [Melioribacteraceae bacterium]
MNQVEKFFDEYAHDFNAIYGTKQSIVNTIANPLFRKSMWKRYEKSIQNSDPIDGKTALDIGCGPGHYSVALAKKGAAKVTGVDFAKNMIDIATERAKAGGVADKCEFIVADIFDFPADTKFNYSIVMGVMDYIENPATMIEKVISLTSDKAFFSFPIDGGLLAYQRKIRYKKRCPLFLYTEKSIADVLNQFDNIEFSIEKISRDFFVTLSIKQG